MLKKRKLDHRAVVRYIRMAFPLLLAVMIVTVYAPVSAFSSFYAPGNTYYVSPNGDDNGPGTKSSPWRTIQKAADTLGPGETVLVREGIYQEFVTIRSSGSESGGYIIFQAYPGERPVIDGTGLNMASGQSALIQLRSANYVVVDGFEIRNLISSSSSQYPAGIRVQSGGSNIHILNNDVHHIENRSSSGNAHGIHIYGNAVQSLKQVWVSGNRVHHLVLGSSESVTLSGNIDGFVVDGNVIHDNNNIGIDVAGFYGACSAPCTDQARNGIVSGNTVYNIDSSVNPAYGSGSNSAGGIYADGAANVVIERNHIYGSDFGIEIASENYGKTTSGITVRNNYVHHNDGAGIIMGGSGAGNGGAADNLILNNTLVENDQLRQGYGEITLQHNNRNNVIANNLIYASAGTPMVYKSNTTGSGNVVDYNLYYRTDGADGKSWRWDGQSYKTWEAFRQATGHDTHSIFAEPNLTDYRQDIRLTDDSPAIDSGTDAYTPSQGTYDYYGLSRAAGAAIDIGATEYGGVVKEQPEPKPTIKPTATPAPTPTVAPVETPVSSPKPTPSIQPGGDAPAASFTVDGDFSDWSDVAELASGRSNVRSIKSVIADGQLHLLITGSLLGEKGQLYLNTDGSTDTGFQAPYWTGTGADYLLENGILYRYSGKGGTNWGWTEIRSYKRLDKFIANSTVVEASLKLSDLGVKDAQTIYMGYVWKDSSSHRLPEGGSPLSVKGAAAASAPIEEPAGEQTAIKIDGSASDWSGITALASGDATPRLLKVHHDAEYLYLLIEGSDLKTKTQVYLNTDGNSGSGYKASNWASGGAEYLLEYGRLYSYTGKGSNWSWREEMNLKRPGFWVERDECIEAAIPLSKLGLRAGDAVTIGILKDDNRKTQLPISGNMLEYSIK